MSNVQLGYTQVIDPISFKSIPSGKIYIGEYGTLPNPSNAGTWKQAYFVNSDGTRTVASQPIRTNAAGYAVDGSGNIKSVEVTGLYSMLVQDQFSATKFSITFGGTPSDAQILTVDSITNVDATSLPDGIALYAKGYSTPGDGGGGIFRYSSASVQSADNGLVFAPLVGSGRLFRDSWTVFGFNGSVNPLWWGAVAGAADSTAALQGWLNADATEHHLPRGEFKATGLTAKARTISGAGLDVSMLTLVAAGGTLLQMTEGGITLQNLTLKSALGKASVTVEHGLVTASAMSNPKVIIRNVHATGFSRSAFKLTDTYNLVLERLQVLQSKYGVEFDNVNFSTQEACNGGIISNCYFGTCDRGLYTAKQVNWLTLIDNVYEYNIVGAELIGRGLTLINNYYEGNSTAGANYKGNGFRTQRKQTSGTDTENLLTDAGLGGGWVECGLAGILMKDHYGSYADLDGTQGFKRLTAALVSADSTAANNRSNVSQLYTGYTIQDVRNFQAAGTPTAELLIESTRSAAGNGIAQPALVWRSSSVNGSVRSGFGRIWKSDYFGNMTPGDTDNTCTNGSATNRWSVVYAGTGTINTSDEREKTFLPITDAELDAWADVEWRAFQFNDAVEKKGDDARIHFGLGAQSVIDVFARHGLDATRYALLCYDEWDEQESIEEIPEVKDEDGKIVQHGRAGQPYRAAGNRYGIRYVEALSLEAALMRRTQKRLELRISELESK